MSFLKIYYRSFVVNHITGKKILILAFQLNINIGLIYEISVFWISLNNAHS